MFWVASFWSISVVIFSSPFLIILRGGVEKYNSISRCHKSFSLWFVCCLRVFCPGLCSRVYCFCFVNFKDCASFSSFSKSTRFLFWFQLWMWVGLYPCLIHGFCSKYLKFFLAHLFIFYLRYFVLHSFFLLSCSRVFVF